MAAARIDAVYHFLGLGATALADDLTASVLRDAARSLEERVGAVVVTGEVEAPRVVEGLAADLTLPGAIREALSETTAPAAGYPERA